MYNYIKNLIPKYNFLKISYTIQLKLNFYDKLVIFKIYKKSIFKNISKI